MDTLSQYDHTIKVLLNCSTLYHYPGPWTPERIENERYVQKTLAEVQAKRSKLLSEIKQQSHSKDHGNETK